MPSRGISRSRGQVLELRAMQTDTNGGSSDTDVNELAARPSGTPPANAATAVTPVGKVPNTRRSSAGSCTRTLLKAVSAGWFHGPFEGHLRDLPIVTGRAGFGLSRVRAGGDRAARVSRPR